MLHTFRSSGDLSADRRYAYARALAEARDFPAAADLYRQTLELAPDWLPALAGLAEALVEAGAPAEAAPVLERMLALDPADAFGAALRLAAIGRAPVPEAPPEAYVRGLFDAYADRFDEALVDRLGYRVPELIEAAVARLKPEGSLGRVLDLGCGTGLMGERLRGRASALHGIDLSPEMVARARARGIYDGLVTGDVSALMDGRAPVADLVVAADLFVYVGRLEAVFAGLAATLPEGALFVFSAERAEDGDVVLRDSLRYAHSEAYLRAVATAHFFEVAAVEPAVLRRDRGADVAGLIVSARLALPAGREAAGSVGGEAAKDDRASVLDRMLDDALRVVAFEAGDGLAEDGADVLG